MPKQFDENRRNLLRKGAMASGAALALSPLSAFARACLGLTPAQPEGPFYPVGNPLDRENDNNLVFVRGGTGKAQGQVIGLEGQVLDENCMPIAGALVDIWQANSAGKYNHPSDPSPAPLDPNFQYSGWNTTDSEGRYRFLTIIPGAYAAGADWIRPPHIHIKVIKEGFIPLTTQLYFEGNEHNSGDRILQGLRPEEQAKVVRPVEGGSVTFDIQIQRA